MNLCRRLAPYLLLVAVTVTATFFYILFLSKTPLFLAAHFRTGDTLFAWRARYFPLPKSHLEKIVVIGVDDESFQRLNRSWPWGREIFAVVLDNLRSLNPKVVAVDFSFVGKSQNHQADQWFQEAIEKSKNVVLVSYFDRENPAYPYILPAEMFRKAARACGFINIPFDSDEINRRARILIQLEEGHGYAYTFATQIAYAYWGLKPEDNIKLDGSKVIFSLPENDNPSKMIRKAVPLDRKYHTVTSFRYSRNVFKYIPLWKVIAGEVSRKEIEGKIILVGPISPVLHDVHSTTVGRMPGIFINANQVLTILDHDFVKKLWPYNLWLILLTISAITAVLFYKCSYIQAVILLLALEFWCYIGAQALLLKGWLVGIFSLLFVIALSFFIALFSKGLGTFLENLNLQRQVVMDGLTGLYGHRYLSLRLETEFRRHEQLKKEFCLAMLDIDLFKNVNDTYGHEEGNVVLTTVARLLRNNVRGYDVAARYGGEEFCILLFNSDQNAAIQTMERIRQAIENSSFATPQGVFHSTISVGICSNQTAGIKSKDDLIRLADMALYEAKAAGRNQIRLYQSPKK